MPQQIIIFIGPPGAGKGTQADLLAEEKGFFHLESSKVIEEKFKSAPPDDPIIFREMTLWKTGKLNTRELVIEWMLERIRQEAAEGKSLVLSGSPRELLEAEMEIPVMEELYGPQNVHVFHLSVPEARSVERNTKRRICKANRHPIPNLPTYANLTTCPKDGSELITRVLDTPDIIKVRLQEYATRTAPIIAFLKKRGSDVTDIDGDNTIEAVHHHVIEALERRRFPVTEQ